MLVFPLVVSRVSQSLLVSPLKSRCPAIINDGATGPAWRLVAITAAFPAAPTCSRLPLVSLQTRSPKPSPSKSWATLTWRHRQHQLTRRDEREIGRIGEVDRGDVPARAAG